MIKELTCIVCPVGCLLEAKVSKTGEIIQITGNTCPRGEAYARNELSAPMRMLTSTVKIRNALYNRLPVILSKEIPKDKLFAVMEEINKLEVQAPVSINAVLLKNVCGLSADVIASRSMKVVERRQI